MQQKVLVNFVLSILPREREIVSRKIFSEFPGENLWQGGLSWQISRYFLQKNVQRIAVCEIKSIFTWKLSANLIYIALDCIYCDDVIHIIHTQDCCIIMPYFRPVTLKRRTEAIRPQTMRKLCLSTKLQHPEIRWNYGILCTEISHWS